MVADRLRGRSQRFIDAASKPFMALSPNTISAVSFILAVISGYAFFRSGYFIIVSFFALLFSALFDAVDGNVARRRNLHSKKGDLVDHVLDRFSDIAVIAGMVFSPYGSIYIGFFALEGIMMTSYMGTQSQALGLSRNYSGILGRSDRLILMLVFILLQFFVKSTYTLDGIAFTVTVILLIWFAVAGNVTAVTRFMQSYRSL